jgi:CBS-domain-containing membrane protein
MAQVFHRPSSSLFATDGKPHPLQDTLMAVTLVLGALAFITAQFHSLHLISSWAGLVGIVTGAYGQYVSVTTRERTFLIVGLGASAVGFFLGMARGGLFGGLLG